VIERAMISRVSMLVVSSQILLYHSNLIRWSLCGILSILYHRLPIHAHVSTRQLKQTRTFRAKEEIRCDDGFFAAV
jgi:hypothetical protein